MKRIHSLWGAAWLAAIPALAAAQNADFDALLAQVPAPPVKLSAADLRWHEGQEVNGSQEYFDKDADALLDKINKAEQALQQDQFSYGGDSAQEMQKKMAGMTQQEKMAYAMQLAKKAQDSQRAAYMGANGQALAQAQQNDVNAVQKGLAASKAAKAMDDLETQYRAKFNALYDKMHAEAKACPDSGEGAGRGPSPACIDPILDRYRSDYRALAAAQMAGYNAIYLQYKKDAAAEIKGWEADIAKFKDDGNETTQNVVVRKKLLIYEEIKDLAIPADRAVDLGHQALQMDPRAACGGDCTM